MTVVQAANGSSFWLIFGWVLTLSGIGFLLVAMAGTPRTQKLMPGLGRLRGVQDHRFQVVPIDEWLRTKERLKETENPSATTGEPPPTTFETMKPLIQSYRSEGRKLYLNLLDAFKPDQVAVIYHQAADWERRVITTLKGYHSRLSQDFEHGGAVLSPRLEQFQPTDKANLLIFIERRGLVLRNVLDGTPEKGLEWSGLYLG